MTIHFTFAKGMGGGLPIGGFILGEKASDVAHIEKAAEIIGKYTNGGVLVKGGHAVFNEGLAEDCFIF